MAKNGIDPFLHAEEEANRLMDELTRLKKEIESYSTARQALGQAAEAGSKLAGRLAEIAGQLGEVVETLRSIGTPELLRGQEAIARDAKAIRDDMNVQLAGTRAAMRTIQNLVFVTVGLQVMALALLAWLAVRA